MPKLGMEPIRREALMKATIAEIGAHGSLEVTVSAIAKRAGMSSALAHHYFGGKDQIFLAAMRHTLSLYGQEVRSALRRAQTPLARVEAILQASFSSANFQPSVIAAWLNFYVLAQSQPEAQRLLNIYQSRLRSNLRFALRPLIGVRAPDVAERIAALIDGLYLRQSLVKQAEQTQDATQLILQSLNLELEAFL